MGIDIKKAKEMQKIFKDVKKLIIDNERLISDYGDLILNLYCCLEDMCKSLSISSEMSTIDMDISEKHDCFVKTVRLEKSGDLLIDSIINTLFHNCNICDAGPFPLGQIDMVKEGDIPCRSYDPIDMLDLVPKISKFLKTDKKFDYYSEEFRRMRHQVFLRDGEVCAKCGDTQKPGKWLEIDHIKPVSKYPELALDINNMQVLCKKCNRQKSNKNCIDYRSVK